MLGLAGVLIFGLTLPATKLAVAEIDALTVAFGRALSAAVLAGALLLTARQPPPRGDFLALVIASAGLVLGFPLFATLAMLHAPASHGGVVLAVLPLATAMAGVVLAGERPSPGFWAAALAGTALALAFALINGAAGEGFALADLYLVAAVVCAAIGYAQSGVLAQRIGGWQVICWALVIAMPALVAALALFGKRFDPSVSAAAWGGFLYVAIMSQFLGFFFWNKGLALGGVARTGQLQLLQPFVTLMASAVMLGEAVGLIHVGFAAAIMVCVALSRSMHVASACRK